LGDVTQTLDRAHLEYRIGENGDAVLVPRSLLGKARATTAAGSLDSPPSVGLELFKESDFSSTDFAQRINYQRALQGELTRTIQTIAGVRSARVHVILADNGLFKRNAAKASAAVSLTPQPGREITPTQVRGIQRLVAASVPEIRIEDVVVLDESGTSLTRATNEADGELSSAQLDLKRQADRYLQSKLEKLLADLAPQGSASLSVDTLLEDRQSRVTTDEPVATRGSVSSGHVAGVLVKERQSQRGGASGGFVPTSTGSNAVDSDTDWEYEYKVGNRVEQTLSSPGSIKRISVAVALRGAPAQLSSADVEALVAAAVGIDHSRGDSVTVVLLPGSSASLPPSVTGSAAERPAMTVARVSQESVALAARSGSTWWTQSFAQRVAPVDGLTVAVVVLVLVSIALAWRIRRRAPVEREAVDTDAVAAKVRQWMSEGGGHGHA
jgi:flagellar M-ring protein FliF